MDLWKYRLQKTWLNKCLKSCVLEHASTKNMANGSKHCYNLNDRRFTIFFYHSGDNYVGKSLF